MVFLFRGEKTACRKRITMSDIVTINENRDFRRAYARGKSFVDPILVTYVIKNRNKAVRCGITTSKKTGNAVQRNRSRRIIREAFRLLSPELSGSWDLVFVARAKTPRVKSTDIARVMQVQLRQAGVLK